MNLFAGSSKSFIHAKLGNSNQHMIRKIPLNGSLEGCVVKTEVSTEKDYLNDYLIH